MKEANHLAVFQPGTIGNVKIKNRLVRSATFEQMATERGEATDRLVNLYRALGAGGVGLIITGHTAIHNQGYSNPVQMRITDDTYIKGLKRISSAVHELNNGCKIFLQLTHAGRQQPRPELAHWAVAPSGVFDVLFQRTPRVLKLGEIDEIADCFAEGIRRARDAGFDGAQLHAAHGWLLSSFLSPHTNRRDDGYGGNIENRTRIFRDIYERARDKVDESFPIILKMNTDDLLPGGMDLTEAARTAKALSEIGFAAIETSGGMWETLTKDERELGWKPVPIPEARVGIRTKTDEAYFWDGAKIIRKAVNVPIVLVGGIRSLEKVEEILDEGSVDFCSMCRPFILEPDLPNMWASGKTKRKKAKCISCNECLPRPGRSLECRMNEEASTQGGHALDMFPYFKRK